MVRHLRVLFDDEEFAWLKEQKRTDEDWAETILREFGNDERMGPPEDWEYDG